MHVNFKRANPKLMVADMSLPFLEKNADTELFCHDPVSKAVEWVKCSSLLLSRASTFLCSLVQGGALRRRDGFYEISPVSFIVADASAKDIVKVLLYLNGGDVLFSSSESLDDFTSLLENLGINVHQEGREFTSRSSDLEEYVYSPFAPVRPSKKELNEFANETDTNCLEKNNNGNLSSDGFSLTDYIGEEICEEPSTSQPTLKVESTTNPKQIEMESAIADNKHVPLKEVDQDSFAPQQSPYCSRNVYAQFYYLPDDCPPPVKMYKGKLKKSVRCSLCDKSGEVKWVSYGDRSTHMRRFHLPDEACGLCGEMVRPLDLYTHRMKLCKNREKCLPLEDDAKKKNCHVCNITISKSNHKHVKNCLKKVAVDSAVITP